jgi:LmbE family N-acetylglucosaminyl deacetylase
MSNKMTTDREEARIKNKHTVLVVVAHPDDEALGLGGTISKHVENGDIVYGVSMTDGVGARGGANEEEIKVRAQASINSEKILGFTWLEGGNFPDNAMDSVPLLAVVKVIEKAKFLVNPTLVYTHSSADLNIDHRVVSQATLTAFRPQPNEVWQEIRTFETASATDYGHKSITNLFYPNLYIDITGTWEKKLAALHEYKMEMRDAPHSCSFEGLENLAKHRGNQVGLKYAEAFEIIRKIDR